jgi:hypothetical protein
MSRWWLILLCAGHLEPGTRTYTFVIVTLGVFGDEVDLRRLDDTSWR